MFDKDKKKSKEEEESSDTAAGGGASDDGDKVSSANGGENGGQDAQGEDEGQGAAPEGDDAQDRPEGSPVTATPLIAAAPDASIYPYNQIMAAPSSQQTEDSRNAANEVVPPGEQSGNQEGGNGSAGVVVADSGDAPQSVNGCYEGDDAGGKQVAPPGVGSDHQPPCSAILQGNPPEAQVN